jgi:hypothetical protein
MRVSEALAIAGRHFTNEGRTITVEQHRLHHSPATEQCRASCGKDVSIISANRPCEDCAQRKSNTSICYTLPLNKIFGQRAPANSVESQESCSMCFCHTTSAIGMPFGY